MWSRVQVNVSMIVTQNVILNERSWRICYKNASALHILEKTWLFSSLHWFIVTCGRQGVTSPSEYILRIHIAHSILSSPPTLWTLDINTEIPLGDDVCVYVYAESTAGERSRRGLLKLRDELKTLWVNCFTVLIMKRIQGHIYNIEIFWFRYFANSEENWI